MEEWRGKEVILMYIFKFVQAESVWSVWGQAQQYRYFVHGAVGWHRTGESA